MGILRQGAAFSKLAPAERAAAFMSPAAQIGRGVEGDIVRQVGRIAENPYSLAFNSRPAGVRALQAAGGRARRAGAGGNVGVATGRGTAILDRGIDESKQRIGDERMAQILLPFLSGQNNAYAGALQSFMNQPKKKKKKSGLSRLVGTVGDMALNYYTGGGWGAASGGGFGGGG